MKKLKSLVLVALCCVMLVSFTACDSTDTLAKIKEKGELIVATNAAFPPFEYLGEGEQGIIGWDMDIAKEIAKELGVKLRIDNMEFDGVLNSVASNKAHIGMAGLSNNEKRRKQVDFSMNVFDSSQVMIVKKDNTTIKTPFDLLDKTIGAQRGTVGEYLAKLDPDWAFDEDGKEMLGKPKSVEPYDSGAMAVDALISGKVDCVIIDKYPAIEFAKKNATVKIVMKEDNAAQYSSVFDDEYAFAMKKGNTELVNEVNKILTAMKADGRMQAITTKYFG